MGPNVKITLLILNAGGIGRLVCIPLILARVTFLMRKIPKSIPLRTVELCGINWNNWLGMEGYNSFCIGLMVRETMQGRELKEMLLQGPFWT